MYSSNTDTPTPDENVTFHTTLQLNVPTGTSTASIATKLRTNSITKESSPTRKIRCSLSALSISYLRRTGLNKRKNVRDPITQTSSYTIENHSDNNNQQIMPSNEYLSIPRHCYYSRSKSCSSVKYNKRIKSTLLGIWKGLNNDESRCSTISLIDSKCLEEHDKKNISHWKSLSKVVTSLLSFTKTKEEQDQWTQLVGHPGSFKEGIHKGYILKELNEQERYCCELLQNDVLKDFVPKYNGIVKDEEGKCKDFIEMEDLLSSFHKPCIMDCKIGVRTYLEDELDKSEPRTDLYSKMIAIDPLAPTEKENEEKKILKPRYMIWRESLSSTQDLGFRIEAIKDSHSLMSKEFQRLKERNDIKTQLKKFIANSLLRASQYLERLIELRSTCVRSQFFQTHELIGSSLLFVHDENKSSIWMIDFGKTRLLPDGIHTTHLNPWIRGSHEDGYLFGLDNLISIFREIINEI